MSAKSILDKFNVILEDHPILPSSFSAKSTFTVGRLEGPKKPALMAFSYSDAAKQFGPKEHEDVVRHLSKFARNGELHFNGAQVPLSALTYEEPA